MRSVFLTVLSAALIAAGTTPVVSAAPDLDVYSYLENPRITGEGQEPHHAELRPYADRAAAVRGDERTPFTRSLDGDWKIKMADLPERVPAGFHAAGYDVRDWRTVRVPHTWQTDGLDHPIFRNIAEEIVPDTPPKVPRDVNPTAAYAKDFDLPATWAGRRTFLRFEGTTSSYFVWVNGRRVGYDQGGYTPAEFDITDALKPGRNRLAVQVHRWAAGAYLEDVDQWRFAGIFRSVWLYSTPASFVRDVTVHTDLDADYRDARLDAKVELAGKPTGEKVTASLHDSSGREVARTSAPADQAELALSMPVANPAKWTDETPDLYTLVLEYGGHITSETVGFREITIADKQLLVNGERVLFKGVNRAETDPDHGRHQPRDKQLRDVKLLKDLHVNAVRTSHYPSDPHFYDLADRHGLWIDDEVDIETHSREDCPSRCLADKPEWQDAFLERFVAMVERDKNHPSVFMWDTGNEAGLGAAHHRMAEWAKRNAPGRPLYHQPNKPDGDAPFADVWGPRYPTPARLAEQGRRTTKPVIMGEYAHAQGNSLGNFREFWEEIRANPVLQGGFIWDWAEQNLLLPLRIAPDSSPSRISAHLSGMPKLVDGRRGKALSLSGLDDFVEVYRDRRLDITEQLTLDAWVKPAEWRGSMTMIAKGDHQYALKLKNEKTLEFHVHGGGSWHTVYAPVPADFSGNWHRVSGTFDGSALRLFLDGKQVGETAWAGRIDNTAFPVNIGRNPELHQDFNGRMSHGVLDDVRIYDRALSPEQLAADPVDRAVLALDFDRLEERGRYSSYGAHQSGADGLINTDRTLQPETAQLAWVHQPLRFAFAGNQVSITNEQVFAAVQGKELRWRITEGARVLREGRQALRVEPGQTVRVGVPVVANPGDVERKLTVEVVEPGGRVFAHDQFGAGGKVVPGAAPPRASGPAKVTETGDSVVLSGARFRYTVDKRTGTLTSMNAEGAELLKQGQGPRLDAWRAPIDNERVWGYSEEKDWRAVGLDRLVTTVQSVQVEGGKVIVRSTVAAPGVTDASFAQTVRYEVDDAGTVRLATEVVPQGRMRKLTYLPRIGTALGVPDHFHRFSWYGRQKESYNDRRDGTPIGVWTSTVEAEQVGYDKPQDNGNRTDTRWALLTDGRTGGLLVTGTNDVAVSSYDDTDRAEYPFQRQRNSGWTTLHAGHAASGVGDTPNPLLPQYRVVADRDYRYELVLRPLARDEVRTGLPRQSR